MQVHCLPDTEIMSYNGTEGNHNLSSADGGTFGKGLTVISWNVEYICFAIYLGIFSLVGILGNIPVLIVYFNKREQTASNTFIKVLAVLDLTVCLFIMPYTMVYELHLVESDIMCRCFEFLRHFIVCSSNITLVAISVERYIAVCRLTKRMSVQHVKKGMFCISILSGGIAAPAIGTFAVVSGDDVTGVSCTYVHDMHNDFCHFTFHILGKTTVLLYQGMLMVLFFITLVLIVIFYLIVYIVLWKRSARRRTTYCKSKEISDHISSVCDLAKSKENCACSKSQSLDVDTSKGLLEPLEMNSERESDLSNKEENVQTGFRKHRSFRRKNLRQSKRPSSDRDRLRRKIHRRTAKMLFLCTVIYLLTWLPFWFDIFGATKSLILRYLFFVGNATNPIVYGIVNVHIRKSFLRVLGCYTQNIFISRTTKDLEIK